MSEVKEVRAKGFYKWTGKIKKVGNKNNPSGMIIFPKRFMTEDGLQFDTMLTIDAKHFLPVEVEQNDTQKKKQDEHEKL
jgi:hypothetical protein